MSLPEPLPVRAPREDIENMDITPRSRSYLEANRSSGRKRLRKDRSASYRKIRLLEKELEKAKQSAEKYKKRCQRYKKKSIVVMAQKPEEASPFSKALQDTKGYKVPETVKKTLVFHNALVAQIKENYANSSSEKEKQIISRATKGSIVKKYKCITRTKKILKCHASPKKINKKGRSRAALHPIHKRIIQFFNRDDVTTLTPGKKQTITRYKIKYQKRLLNDTMKILYEKYCKEYPEHKISFATFCRHRPCWVVQPKLSDRDSCLCKKHSNMQHKLNTLVNEKLCTVRNIEKVCNLVTCDATAKNCMKNICLDCQNKPAIMLTDKNDPNKLVYWNFWKLEKEKKTKAGKTFTLSKTKLVRECGTLKDLCTNFNTEMKTIFCWHVFKKNYQTNQRQKCIAELTYEEAAVHMDFSENYSCKMSAEIQDMHFGSSHNQASLHTVVVYYENKPTESICTISSCTRHDPSSIWAHLVPILKELRENGIQNVHFFSDGPTSQYRNKQNFYFLNTVLREYGFLNATWNFSEASHGKGAPDGVGAAVKRVADGLVSKGNDIPDAKALFTSLQGKVNVKLYWIDLDEISNFDSKKEINSTCKMIKGIMKIGQVILSDSKEGLYGRELSCFCKKMPASCSCHTLQKLYYQDIKSVEIEDHNPDTTLEPQISSDISQEIKIGQWVLVQYNSMLYPGIVTDYDNEESYQVKVLQSVGFNKYVWPVKEDKIWYSFENIVRPIEPPYNATKRVLQFKKPFWLDNEEVN